MSGPRTEAGRRLTRNLVTLNLPNDPASEWPEDAIAAIEQEAVGHTLAALTEKLEAARDRLLAAPVPETNEAQLYPVGVGVGMAEMHRAVVQAIEELRRG